MTVKKKFLLIILLLLILGGATRMLFIWYPAEVVFDEVYFGKFAAGYLKGEYFFDIHPPLGKLLVSGMAYLGHLKPDETFSKIGDPYNGYTFIWLRFLPALFGALLPTTIFLFLKSLRASTKSALFAGIAVLLESALITHSRFILLDSMLLFFGFAGLALFFYWRNYSKKWWHLVTSGILLAFSLSIKWTGISFLGLACLVLSYDDAIRLAFKKNITQMGRYIGAIGFLLTVSFLIYMSVFAVHFSLLKKSGSGDAFMSQSFLKTLFGTTASSDPSIRPPGFWSKFVELNTRMYTANNSITQRHPSESRYYAWPLMVRPIYYWEKIDSSMRKIVLAGNPVIWGLALGFLLIGVVVLKSGKNKKIIFLYVAWLVNILPFIPIKRPLFLYHYFPSLIFSIAIMSIVLFDSTDNNLALLFKSRLAFAVIITMFVIGFLAVSFYTYGLPF